jgi:thiol-disulfide isomerase/thioredoxin
VSPLPWGVRSRAAAPARRVPVPAGRRLVPARRLAAVAALAAAVVAVAACEGGAIGQSTPASNGQSFVSGNPGTTVYRAGHGPAAPKISGTTLGGAKLSLSGFRGHIVVINFWGSWCTPCRSEAPVLASLDRTLRPEGVRFLGVDIRDQTASAEAFIRDFRIAYPSLSDPADEIALAFRATVPPAAIPTTLVIGRDGLITARLIGEVSLGGLKHLIGQAARGPA